MPVGASRGGWRYRANVAVRAGVAVLGGYALAALVAFAAARAWPLDRLQASIAGTMLGFVAVPAGACWAFLARTPLRALGGMAGACAGLAAIAALIGPHP